MLGILPVSVIVGALVRFALPKLIEVLFRLIEKKLGKGWVNFAGQLIEGAAQAVEDRNVKGSDVRDEQVRTLKESTQASKGLPEWLTMYAHQIVYAKWLKENRPEKFKEAVDRLSRFEKKGGPKVPSSKYMAWLESDNKQHTPLMR